MYSTKQLRQIFVDFFQSKSHEPVPSSPLVLDYEPTLLFVNAGMVQFKQTFLGQENRPYTRATSVQRCVRAGGKHNDLENVGYTARHHTFFEMVGNFSFGDYFKREAISYAWEFLTKTLNIPAEKLWVTVFEEDQEAENIWLKEINVDPKRFSRIGAKDNFWSMGDTGPCGPCTEIFYDHGEGISGGPPGSPDEDGDRYIEIWNLVFMQYNRAANGKLTPLEKPSIDTGMGLERLAAVMQNVHDNYDIDLFKNLIASAAQIVKTKETDNRSLRVLADHIRSCAFLIVDGVRPSNEGRGYVLRRIIRRAVRHGHKLGAKDLFFYKLVEALVAEMGEAYPMLKELQAKVEEILKKEEAQFAKTLQVGLKLLQADLNNPRQHTIPGEVAFKLYDTYGFPVDLTADIAREHEKTVDIAGFEACMNTQRERARAASQFDVDYNETLNINASSEFKGYETLAHSSVITHLFKSGEAVNTLEAGDEGMLVLEASPFYAESGGQVGDTGIIEHEGAKFKVLDTQKMGDSIVHIGRVEVGTLKEGIQVQANVDIEHRGRTILNHSATHLLHAALRSKLGSTVTQKGSLVDAEKLRFDFSHDHALSVAELQEIEQMVNAEIRANNLVETKVTSPEDAKKMGAMALFGEKYGDSVRVLKMGAFSMELCGGTHAERTGDIGLFKIVSEGGIAAGVRRIEAVTGELAWQYMTDKLVQLNKAAALLKVPTENVAEKITQSQHTQKQQEKTIEQLKSKLASQAGSDLLSGAEKVGETLVLAKALEDVEGKDLRGLMDQVKSKAEHAVIVLAAKKASKVSLVAGVTNTLTKQYKAGELVNYVAQQVGGKGGGRPDMAQAGGTQPENLEKALASVLSWVKEKA